MKRLIAVLAASILLVGLIAFHDTRYGTRTDGLYYKATGIHPDAQILRVNGEGVSAEEYLYWLSSVCDYLYSYTNGQVDFSAALTEEMTFGEYAKTDAVETVKLYALVRQIAEKEQLTLRQEDLDALEQQRAQYISYYGSEDAYLQQLQLLGINEEALRSIDSVPYLYAQIHDLHCSEDGRLRPSDEALLAHGQESGYVTAQLLYFATTGLDEASIAKVQAKAADYAARWQAESDKMAAYYIMASELNLEVDEAGLTFEPTTSDPAVCQAVEKLDIGAVSGVIEGESGYYVAMRMDLNADAMTEDLFNIYLQELQDSAKVDYSKKLYNSIDAGNFYITLNAERTFLMEQLSQQQ